jgi:DNA helicase HerA-like ATPase
LTDVTRAARIVVAVGASGSGKSSFAKGELARTRPRRLLIVDPDDEYGAFAHRAASLREAVDLTAAPTFAVRVRPHHARELGTRQFAFACALAWERAPCVFVVDELADYVTAAAGPDEWLRLVRRGRKQGVAIYALSQRPALIDKTLWSQATTIRTGWLAYRADQVAIAAALGVRPDELAGLAPLDWIERDRNGGELRRGKLAFDRSVGKGSRRSAG